MRSRRQVAVIVVAASVLASLGGYAAGARIQSPAEVAARTAPPEPSPILVPAEMRLLQTDIITRGTARFVAPQAVAVAASTLKVDPQIVTRLPAVQDQLTEGSLAAAASGRPVLVLQGAEPMYRDLGPGAQGSDVRQLEEALARLGFQPGPVDGLYDQQTEAAVAAWYQASGWQPFEATAEQLKTIRAMQQDMVSTQRDRLSADDAVAAARADVAAAQAARSAAEAAASTAALELQLAQAEAAAANDAAAKEVAAKQATRDRLLSGTANDADRLAADRAVQAAQSALATARAKALTAAEAEATALQAIDVAKAEAAAADAAATAEVAARTAERDAIYADPTSTPDQKSAADTAVHLAELAASATRASGQAAVQAAIDAHAAAVRDRDAANRDVAQAETELADALALRAAYDDPAKRAEALAKAESDLAAAKAAAEATRTAGEISVRKAQDAVTTKAADRTAAAALVSSASRTLGNAKKLFSLEETLLAQRESDLAGAQTAAGTQVPADEVIFLPILPVRVESLSAAVGEPLAGPIFTATQLQLVVDTSLRLEEVPLVHTGMPVQIDEPSLGIKGTGTIDQIADAPGTNGVDGYHVYAKIRVDEAPASIVGASVRLTIPIESTGGKILAVPLSAVVLAADGTSRVQVQSQGALEYVTVEPGLSASGYVAITPVNGSIAAGDLVVIGFDQGRPPGA